MSIDLIYEISYQLQIKGQRVARSWPDRNRMVRALMVVLAVHIPWGVVPANAQASLFPRAGGAGAPAIARQQGGVNVVNIAAPNAAGVSYNQYEQFNVSPAGLILNNSAQQTATVLGGVVAGNSQMGARPADIIINEVMSAARSDLRGLIEVAGSRADVIVANPNGIHCDGCGFLNAGRATLTSGLPQLNPDGSVQGFNLHTGLVSVGTGGLDARGLQQLDLLARGIVVDGPVRAERIRVLTGASQVDYEGSAVASAGKPGEPAPRFAVDIGELGGMYAGQIYLLATEHGAGVNSRGRLVASSGSLHLSSAGDLLVHDAHGAQGLRMESQRGGVEVTGVVSSAADMAVAAAQEVRNSGKLHSGGGMTVKTPRISQGVDAVLSSNGDLSIDGSLHNSGGRVHVGGDLVVTGKLFNENADLRTERQTTSVEVSEIRYADERTPEESYPAELVRVDGRGNLILPSETYPFERFGHEAYGSVWRQLHPSAGQLRQRPRFSDADPVWARFGVSPPDLTGITAPSLPKGLGDCTSLGGRDTAGKCGGYWAVYDRYAEIVDARRAKALEELQLKLNRFDVALMERTAENYFVNAVNQIQTIEDKVIASQPGEIVVQGDVRLGGGANKDSVLLAEGSFVSSSGFSNHATLTHRTVVTHGSVYRSEGEKGFFGGYTHRNEDPWPVVSVVSGESSPIAVRSRSSPTEISMPKHWDVGEVQGSVLPSLLLNPMKMQSSQAQGNGLKPEGSLISVSDIQIDAPGELVDNSGTMHAHGRAHTPNGEGGTVDVRAEGISNEGAISALATTLRAEQDIVATGARFHAIENESSSSVTLHAGRNVELLPAQWSVRHGAPESPAHADMIERLSSLNAERIRIEAGQDVAAKGVHAHARGMLQVTAQRRIDISPSFERRQSESGPRDEHPTKSNGPEWRSHWLQESTEVRASELEAGEILMRAGGRMGVSGSRLSAQGNLTVEAQNVAIDAATAEQKFDVRYDGDTRNFHIDRKRERAVASALTAGQNATVAAAANAELSGSQVLARDGQVRLVAGGDVEVRGKVINQATELTERANGWLSLSGNAFSVRGSGEGTKGSEVEGSRVSIEAGRDIVVSASALAGGEGVVLQGDRHVRLIGAQAGKSEQSSSSNHALGVFAVGYSPTIGWRSKVTGDRSDVRTISRTAVKSSGGDVIIKAGEEYSQAGSDATAAGDILISGRDISLAAMVESDLQSTNQSDTQVGVGLGVGLRGFVGQAGGAVQNLRTVVDAPNWRIAGLRAITGTRSALAAGRMLIPGTDSGGNVTPAQAGQWNGLTGGIRLDAVRNKSSSQSTKEKGVVQAVSVTAGGTVRMRADKREGSLRAEGAQIRGAQLELDAGHIELTAAQQSDKNEGVNSGSWVGAGVLVGSSVGYDAMGGQFSGADARDEARSVPTQMSATRSVRMQASATVNVSGGLVEGDAVVIRSGDRLSIESLQDRSSAQAESSSIDFAAGTGGGVNWGGFSGTAADAESSRVQVADQARIRAGRGGFDIEVGGVTRLAGAILESEAPESKNRISTGRLEAAELHGSSQHQAFTNSGYLGYSSMDAGNLGGGISLLPAFPQTENARTGAVARSAIAPASLLLRQGGESASVSRDVDAERDKAPLALPRQPREMLNEHAAMNMALFFSSPKLLQSEWDAYAQSSHDHAVESGNARAASLWSTSGAFRAAGNIGIDALTGRLGAR